MLDKGCSGGEAMYSIKDYFVEIALSRIPNDGWTATATFSRKDDYARPAARILKTRFDMRQSYVTRHDAEIDALRWARNIVTAAPRVIEYSLNLEAS
jgi:hypothetical protein